MSLFETLFARRNRVTLQTLNTKLDQLLMNAEQLKTRLAALEKNQEDILTFGTEAFTEITEELALLRKQLQELELPADVEETLARLETKSSAGVAKSKELADVIKTETPVEPPAANG